MKELIFGIWIGVQGCLDFKFKEIPLWFSFVGACFGVVFSLIENRTWTSVLLACVPGIVSLIFSWITKEVIGYGDGIVLVVMGMYMSISKIVSIGMIAFGLAGIVALILLVVFHKKGKDRIPFIPFLAMACGIEYVIRMGGSL